jgi:dUTP pyrophosphatase
LPTKDIIMLLVQRLNDGASLPKRGSAQSAGYDLYSNEKCVIFPGERKLVLTGIAIKIPTGHYGRVASLSGLSLKHGIEVGAGVIDEDYRGEVGVLLFNCGTLPFRVDHGDRIAQLIIEQISTPDILEVVSLDSTERAAGGFGSTGTS